MMTLNISVKNCNCIRLILMGVLTVTFACKGQEFKKVELPRNYQAKLDIIYAETASWNGKLDFYYPTNNDEPTPVIINIHGGGWNHGKKESQRGFGSFFKKGMAVANVEYRLESEAKAPAAVEDIRCAMSYLISNAEELNIDTDKIVLMGASAGGHLALMGGLSENNSLFDDHCGEREAVKIRAIIDKYGVSDLRPVMFASSVKKWLGSESENVAFAESLSPITLVDAKSPPIFIVHGDADPIVPYIQSQKLFEKLQAHGVNSKFITIPEGGHGKFKEKDKERIDEIMDIIKAQREY